MVSDMSVIMLNVIMLSVVMLSVVMLSVVMLSVVMLSAVKLSLVIQIVAFCVVMLSVINLTVFKPYNYDRKKFTSTGHQGLQSLKLCPDQQMQIFVSRHRNTSLLNFWDIIRPHVAVS